MSGIMSMVLGAKTAIAAAVDAYFNLVTLLLPGDGTNGAQNNTFLDSSTNNFTITRNGNTTQGTFSPFSQTGWSNYFNGSTDSIYTPSNAALGFGTGDFTVEFWIYPLSIASKSLYHGSATNSLVINTDASGKFIVRQYGVADLFTSSAALSTNAWNHVAVSRSGTTISAWLNGSRANGFTGTNSTNWATTAVYIGAADTAANYVNAYFSNVRVVKGTDVYGVNNSTITVPTSPLTAITNTSLLTCQSNRFIDNSTNAFAITVNGTPSVQAFSPFAPTAAYSAATNGGSGYFDGNGDYLNVASNAAFDIEGGAYTIEGWFYFNSIATGQRFFVFDGTSQTRGVIVGGSSTNNLEVNHFGVGTVITATNALVGIVGSWAHVCIASNGTNRSIFVNGTRYATSTSALFQNTNNAVGIAGIGGTYSGSNPNAYISGFRVVKGTAVYDPTLTTLTVPTAPLTAITNTQLLANFTNAGITDATAKNDLETVGNAQISTTQSKFGGSSMYFDGTGDRLLAATSPLYDLGSGNWTVECWVYASNLSSMRGVFAKRGNADGEVRWINAAINTNGTIYTEIATSSSAWGIQASTTTAISATTWAHIAWVRNGSDVSVYVNGTKNTLSSSFTSSVYNGTEPFVLGANGTSGSTYFYQMNGYIDDFRITRGYARYTATFTPPTEAFALQ